MLGSIVEFRYRSAAYEAGYFRTAGAASAVRRPTSTRRSHKRRRNASRTGLPSTMGETSNRTDHPTDYYARTEGQGVDLTTVPSAFEARPRALFGGALDRLGTTPHSSRVARTPSSQHQLQFLRWMRL